MPDPGDGAPEGCRALLLLGPGPGFWAIFAASAEYADGAADPLDRWSRRVIGVLAEEAGAVALFPFDGPPFRPFQRWARASGRVWESPVALLVHAEAGLFISFRGALCFTERVAMPIAREAPCPTCAAPCTSACPVGALGPAGYDVARCRTHLDSPAGRDCLDRGCLARRACPLGAQTPEQAMFHMAAFHPPGFHGRQNR
ncbi:MAG: ferredoxin [Amaricoccus sp.]